MSNQLSTVNIPKLQSIIDEHIVDGCVIRGWGKPGHGLNGKDADLNREGQCVVEKVEVEEQWDQPGRHGQSVVAHIHLRLYASICAPSYDSVEGYRDVCSYSTEKAIRACGVDFDDDNALLEFLQDQATSIVCGMDPCPQDPMAFMWDGDGAWDGGTDIVLTATFDTEVYQAANYLTAFEFNEYPEESLDVIAGFLAGVIYDANDPDSDVFAPEIKRFEDEVGLANDLINELLGDGTTHRFCVEWSHLNDQGTTTDRTIVGPIATRPEAERLAKELSERPFSHGEARDLQQPKFNHQP